MLGASRSEGRQSTQNGNHALPRGELYQIFQSPESSKTHPAHNIESNQMFHCPSAATSLIAVNKPTKFAGALKISACTDVEAPRRGSSRIDKSV
jgi:hypothetical protein